MSKLVFVAGSEPASDPVEISPPVSPADGAPFEPHTVTMKITYGALELKLDWVDEQKKANMAAAQLGMRHTAAYKLKNVRNLAFPRAPVRRAAAATGPKMKALTFSVAKAPTTDHWDPDAASKKNKSGKGKMVRGTDGDNSFGNWTRAADLHPNVTLHIAEEHWEAVEVALNSLRTAEVNVKLSTGSARNFVPGQLSCFAPLPAASGGLLSAAGAAAAGFATFADPRCELLNDLVAKTPAWVEAAILDKQRFAPLLKIIEVNFAQMERWMSQGAIFRRLPLLERNACALEEDDRRFDLHRCWHAFCPFCGTPLYYGFLGRWRVFGRLKGGKMTSTTTGVHRVREPNTVARTEDGVKKVVVLRPDDDHTYCDFLQVHPDLVRWVPTDIDY